MSSTSPTDSTFFSWNILHMIRSQVGDVTIIINNAGIMTGGKFLAHCQQLNQVERIFEVNVLSHYRIIGEFLPKMIEKKKGHIVTLCSLGGLMGTQNFVAYTSSKFAVNGMIEALRDEMLNHPDKPDIQFTTVYPSTVRTSFAVNKISNNRMPLIYPDFIEPEYVAEQIVDGMRRNYVSVYVPRFVYFVATFYRSFPYKLQWTLSKLVGVYIEPAET